MKQRIVLFGLALILLNSCIVKSLFPFFTKDTIHFEKDFLGTWIDEKDKDLEWNIFSINEIKSFEEKREPTSNDDDPFFKNYKNGYIAVYTTKKSKSLFLVMPFKINDQLFLDFTPFEYHSNNKLVKHHLIPTHSLVKFDITNKNNVSIKWLSSAKIGKLIQQNKIKIKHEKVGIDDTYLLTASPEELQKFIKKYMVSKDADKWKTDIKFDLKKAETSDSYQNMLNDLLSGKLYEEISKK